MPILNTNKERQEIIRKEEFDIRVFRTYQRLNVHQCSDEIKVIIARLDEAEETSDTKTDMEKLRELHKQLTAYIETLDLYYDDYYLLEFIEFYYTNIDFSTVKCFTDAFYSVVKSNSPKT